ncbi:MAG: hypothetical protein CMI54_05095 [Parcubacteria group bacterium]|nr:hypothetical protein [Parcubacteria group bacterium]|tara:strand:+ start:16641 stop:17330 length:690 start_codon:yes stop_codon:yes gene_type:complete
MPTLLILHGWGSSSKKWQKVRKILTSQGLNVLVPDLPGFGNASLPSKPWSVNDYVEWIREFSEKENLSQFFLLGHSFGGRIAIKFSVKYPEKVSGLILSGVPAIRKKMETEENLAGILSKLSFIPGYQFLRKLFYKYILRKTDYIKLKGVMKETFKKIVAEDLAVYLPQIKAKTLILWGDKDDYVPVKTASLIKERVINSEMIIFPGSGHSLQKEIPDKLSESMLNFIK